MTVFYRTSILKNFAKFIEKDLLLRPFYSKVSAQIFKNVSVAAVFPVGLSDFSLEHVQITSSLHEAP